MPAAILYWFLVEVTTLALTSALNAKDVGVCSKTESFLTSRSVTYARSYAQKYETCTLGIFCSTKYRTAYKRATRSLYQTTMREYLACCNGYIEVDDDCKSKVSSTLPMTSAITSPMQTLTTAQSTVSTSLADVTTKMSTLSGIPGVLPLQTTMMAAGIAFFLFVIVILTLFLVVMLSRRNRKRRLSSTSRTTEGQYGQPDGAYYSVITTDAEVDSSTVAIKSLPRDSTSSPQAPDRSKKSTYKNLAVFYAKVIKGRNKSGRDGENHSSSSARPTDDDDEGSDQHSPIVHVYGDMHNTPTKGHEPTPQGYIDMSSPSRTLSASKNTSGYTDMQEDNEYSEMDTEQENQQRNEDAPYDMLGFNEPKTNSYDHLVRTDSAMFSQMATTEQNEYDLLGDDGPGETEEGGIGQETQGTQPYDDLKGSMTIKNDNRDVEETGRVLLHERRQSESTYYNIPDKNAREVTELEQDGVYENMT